MAQKKKSSPPQKERAVEIESAFKKAPEPKKTSPEKKSGSSPAPAPSRKKSSPARDDSLRPVRKNGRIVYAASASPVPAKKRRKKRVDPHASQRRRQEAAYAASRKKSAPAHRKKASSKKHSSAGPAVFMTLASLLLLLFFGFQYQQYRSFVIMRDAVGQQVFYSGTTVEGIDVSGRTLDEALSYWESSIEPRYSDITVTVENASTVTAAQLGYRSNYREVLSAAWNAGRSGTLEERYEKVASIGTGASYTVSRTAYDESLVRDYVSALAELIDREAVSSTVRSFDTESYEFTFTESSNGRQLMQDDLVMSIISAVKAGGGTVTPVVRATEPEFTREEMASRYGMLTYAVTNASSSSRARLGNISLSLASINGTRLRPGETFSFNAVVGQRTTARGYQSAPAYSSGEVIEEVGGGICQVSTTLFNAAVKADLEIVERRAHSMPVAYVDKGKDATVSWGVQDLKIRNNSQSDIYICCYLSDNKRVYVAIFGLLREDGVTITLDPVITETSEYRTIYQDNYFLASGTTNVLKKGRTGYKVTTYKVYWDADGRELRREVLCTSNYGKQDEIIEVGCG